MVWNWQFLYFLVDKFSISWGFLFIFWIKAIDQSDHVNCRIFCKIFTQTKLKDVLYQGCYKAWTNWKTWKGHWILKNLWKTWKNHRVLKKWLKILKSPLFQTLNNYFRIFRCYKKMYLQFLTFIERWQNLFFHKKINYYYYNKRKRELEKKTNIRQNAIQLEKQKELEGIDEEIRQLIKSRWN